MFIELNKKKCCSLVNSEKKKERKFFKQGMVAKSLGATKFRECMLLRFKEKIADSKNRNALIESSV